MAGSDLLSRTRGLTGGDDGILRVGGRLKHSLLSPEEHFPKTLPHNYPLTDMIIDQSHLRTLYGVVQFTLYTLRQQYWITCGRQAVNKRICRCLRCLRLRTSLAIQQMGNLPEARVLTTRAFLNSGVDYCGPVDVRATPGRGNKSFKGFIAVFVCLSTRAVRIEAVSNYSAAQFIAVFRRFASRRGIPATMTSDCGTNFVGADVELQALFKTASQFFTDIANTLAQDGTIWKFNPPGAPNQGGIWEATVKSVNHHLKMFIGDAKLTYEELSTLLALVEACLNSRPIQDLSDDPCDMPVLTQGRFLIEASLNAIPEPMLMDLKITDLNRWQMIQRTRDDFWSRWSHE